MNHDIDGGDNYYNGGDNYNGGDWQYNGSGEYSDELNDHFLEFAFFIIGSTCIVSLLSHCFLVCSFLRFTQKKFG